MSEQKQEGARRQQRGVGLQADVSLQQHDQITRRRQLLATTLVSRNTQHVLAFIPGDDISCLQ